MSFLPWWLGAPALAAPTVLYFAVTRRPMGVSGSLGRVLQWRASREEDRVEDAMKDEEELARALREATLEEFGEAGLAALEPSIAAPSEPRRAPVPVVLNALFLVGILVGALIVTRLVAPAPTEPAASMSLQGWLGLAFGGLLVGFGARFSGGCTSGHGLSGCSRFVPKSLVATGVFFVTAIVTACAIWGRS